MTEGVLSKPPEAVWFQPTELKKLDYEERIERINKNLEQILGW